MNFAYFALCKERRLRDQFHKGHVLNFTQIFFFFMWVEHDVCVIIRTGYDYVKCNFFFQLTDVGSILGFQ